MSYLRSAGLAVMLIAGLWAMAGTSRTEALAADPEMSVWVDNVWWVGTATDSYTAVPTRWSRDYKLWYRVDSGAMPGSAAQICMPTGFDEPYLDHWSVRPAYLKWDGATNVLKYTATGAVNAGQQMTASTNAVPRYVVETPLVSVTRSVPIPILTADVQTQTLAIDVTLNASLAAYDGLGVSMIWEWALPPEGISYTVLSASGPAEFSPGSAPGSFYGDPSLLVVGTPYHFTADVQVARSGPRAQAAMGDLYHRPISVVSYSADTTIAPATGTSITFNVAPGVDATFSSAVSTTFHPSIEVFRGMQFDSVLAGVGPATPSRIGIGKDKRTGLCGTTFYSFWLEAEGQNLVGGTVTTPLGAVYSLECWEDEAGFGRTSATLADLAEFGPGTYQIALAGSDGVVRNFSTVLPDKGFPTEMPQFDNAQGFETTNKRPTLSWQAPTDPNVDGVFIECWSLLDGEYDFGQFLDKSVTSWTVPVDLEPGAYLASIWYGDQEDDAMMATGGDLYFNIVPEPTTLALLAASGLGVLLRRRGK